ncbi:FG-GAP repeat domain-containing protein [Flavilitoribacter nigricans]|uniref:VCBS repeat-containing protein n=1 Tax=Flavilitoribacter nigricans (strain ATCC 23147 / DSM 23189 / NBRC 102662 / NCIMB 1420 / SS-2) TaxID=1122177 RepID=A0A2D0NB29_FLAN2|nr:VCBS repeat-containing protein [Flavilitoribacter nigricans]PHN05721.1 hypothetical protein CRP01_14690 [Flavilitoribacter nigricans DSM 23189 = NBRC 102662]
MMKKIMNSRHALWMMPVFFGSLLISDEPLRFAEPVDISGGSVAGISALDVADFNQDGLLDVAVLEGGAHAGGRFTLAWFEQKENKTWQRHEFGISEPFDDFIGSARCADMDNDGDPDLILTNDGHTTGPQRVYYYENPGKDKVNAAWPNYRIATFEGWHANDMRIADMDADGLPDIIIRHKGPDVVRILFQNSREDWTVVNAHTGQEGEGLAVGDIDRDGLPDITMTGHWFQTPAKPRQGEYRRWDIDPVFKTINKATKEEVGDLNGDGRLDVLLSPAEHFPKYGGADHDLAWYEAPADPTDSSGWIKHIIRSGYNKAHCAKLADFDGDGDLDVLTAVAWDDKEIRIYFNDEGVFDRSQLIIASKGIYSGAVADMDGDGDLDIVGEDCYAHESKPWLYEQQ